MKTILTALALLICSPAMAAQPEPFYPSYDDPPEDVTPVAPVTGPTLAPAHTITISEPDEGGSVKTYLAWYKRWDASGDNLRIDAPCISACTFFLAYITDNDPRVCMTPRGSLGVHEINNGTVSLDEVSQAWYRMIYPTWMLEWIAAHGGLGDDPKYVFPEDIEGHIRMCDGAPRPTVPVMLQKKEMPIVVERAN